MLRHSVSVPAAALRSRLAAAGFRLLPAARGGDTEEVYERAHDRDGRYTVRVYSAIPREGKALLPPSQSAIRVEAFVEESARGRHPIFEAARVPSTGSAEAVLDRVIDRAREAYQACNEHRNRKRPTRGDR
jgi:hypothetical protein